jgi:hypothetical protein
VADFQVDLNRRHQGRQDYPCKEIEVEECRQIEKEWHISTKRSLVPHPLTRKCFKPNSRPSSLPFFPVQTRGMGDFPCPNQWTNPTNRTIRIVAMSQEQTRILSGFLRVVLSLTAALQHHVASCLWPPTSRPLSLDLNLSLLLLTPYCLLPTPLPLSLNLRGPRGPRIEPIKPIEPIKLAVGLRSKISLALYRNLCNNMVFY